MPAARGPVLRPHHAMPLGWCVPMFTCGLRRSNFAFAMIHSFSQNTVCPESDRIFRCLREQLRLRLNTYGHGAHDADRTRDLVLTKDVLCQLSYVGPHYTAAICSHILCPHPWSSMLELERAMGFEPTTASLEGWNSTTELRPPPANPPTLRHSLCTSPSPRIRHDGTSLNALSRNRARSPRATGLIWTQFGGQARVRTLEAIRQQIYSLPPLSTWVPAR